MLERREEGVVMKSARTRERRKSSRIRVKKGVVAVSQDDELSISRLVDINLEGLAIVQPGSGELEDESLELDILALHEDEGKDLFLSGIKARVVSEVVVKGEALSSPVEHKRYSLNFNNLSSQQYDLLKRFIFWQSAS